MADANDVENLDNGSDISHIPESNPTTESAETKPKRQMSMPKLSKKTWIIVAIVVGALVLIGFGITYSKQVSKTNQLKKENARLSNPQAAAQAESQSLVAKIGQLIDLPSGETPTVATVVDVNKLQSQPFFAKAQNGDKVLLYAQAKQAILYRPSTNKIIQVAPINIGSGTPTTSSSTTKSTTSTTTNKTSR